MNKDLVGLSSVNAPDDDGDMKAAFDEMDTRSREKRAKHRESSPVVLKEAGIEFYSNNGGVHLICSYKFKDEDGLLRAVIFADFWPGTGRWRIRGAEGGFGVFNLVKRMKGERKHGKR